MQTTPVRWLAALALCVGLTACAPLDGSDEAAQSTPVEGRGVEATQVVSGLEGPTQMIDGPDGRLWVAQLAGPENAGLGEVVAVDTTSDEVEVLVDGLDKPTGIAWLDDALWIATPTQVLRAGGNPPGTPQVVVDDLPNNGRSNGTLTPTPDGRLLYETSARELTGGAGVVDGSGSLWTLDPRDTAAAPQVVATGLKNAYAHVYDGDGQLWTTEVAESIGGVAAPDEINRVEPSGDFGWPACVGDQVPVEQFGGTTVQCRQTQPPLVTFAPPGATPTSIVVSPFDDHQFIVALWNAGRVVTVPIDGDGQIDDLVTGLERPQHLLVEGDVLLVSDHATGTIWRVTPPR